VNSALCFLAYAVVAGVTAPRLLDAQTRHGRSARFGVLAWFVAIGTVLASWIAAAAALTRNLHAPVKAVGAAMLLMLIVRVTRSAASHAYRSYRRRRQQLEALALIGSRDHTLGVTVIESPEPLVYCLPGRAPTVVVTTGARAALTPEQLQAVLGHERAHLTGRHSVALAVAYTLARAIPWSRLFRLSADHVANLLEMCADDAAARRSGARTVATALAAMSPMPVPAGAVGAAGGLVLTRARRLYQPASSWSVRRTRLALAMTTAALAAGPFLATIVPFCRRSLW